MTVNNIERYLSDLYNRQQYRRIRFEMLVSCGSRQSDGGRGGRRHCRKREDLSTRVIPTLNDAEQWDYLAEGGANVVFCPSRMKNTASMPDLVLRIPKQTEEKKFSYCDTLDFVQHTILPIMNKNNNDGSTGSEVKGNEKYSFYGTLVSPSSPTFFEELNAKLQSTRLRPLHRLGTALKCTADTQALILPNVVTSSGQKCKTMCCTIELKPKSSLKPNTIGYYGIKQRTCRYCMHQEWKYHCGEISMTRSQGKNNNKNECYCPIDLFSKDKVRMKRAIRSLIDQPQNNFKILSQHFPDDECCETTTDSHSQKAGGAMTTKTKEELIDVVVEVLCQSDVLNDLHHAHKLDEFDIEGIWDLHQIIKSCEHLDGNTMLPECCLLESSSPQQEPLSRHRLLLSAIGCTDKSCLNEVRAKYQHLVEKFLIATTMKDCSVLLSIRQHDKKHGPEKQNNEDGSPWRVMEYEIECNEKIYYALVSIIDLDKKSPSKLSKYRTLDRNILHHYSSNYGLHKRICFGATVPSPVKRSRVLPQQQQQQQQSVSSVAVVQIKGNMMCRLFYPNPVCLLTVYDPAKHVGNVMTITWLTPIDNIGTFVCSINKRRYTAGLLNVSSVFVMNVPTRDMEGVVLDIGSCSGRNTDKFKQFRLRLCCPGWSANMTDSSITDDRIKHSIALADCIAHTVCTVEEKQDKGQHWLMICKQQLAWSRKAYFEDGKCFRRSTESLPPYLTFLGSKTFGSSV